MMRSIFALALIATFSSNSFAGVFNATCEGIAINTYPSGSKNAQNVKFTAVEDKEAHTLTITNENEKPIVATLTSNRTFQIRGEGFNADGSSELLESLKHTDDGNFVVMTVIQLDSDLKTVEKTSVATLQCKRN